MTVRRKQRTADAGDPWFRRPLAPFERLCIVGQTMSGKTTWTKRTLFPNAPRVLIYDGSDDPGLDYGDVARVIAFSELLERPELLAADRVRIAVASEAQDEDERTAEVEAICELARAAGDLLVVFDEVGDYAGPDSQNAGPARYALARLARNGRKQGVRVAFVSQSMSEIPPRARKQASRVISFVQSEPADLDALRARCGDDFVHSVLAWRRGDEPAIWSLASLREGE